METYVNFLKRSLDTKFKDNSLWFTLERDLEREREIFWKFLWFLCRTFLDIIMINIIYFFYGTTISFMGYILLTY